MPYDADGESRREGSNVSKQIPMVDYLVLGDDPHLVALRHEPRGALVAGHDGLDDIRHIVQVAPTHLRAGGWLLLEHGHDQPDAVADLLRRAGFEAIAHRHDLAGMRRCTGGRWPGAALPASA